MAISREIASSVEEWYKQNCHERFEALIFWGVVIFETGEPVIREPEECGETGNIKTLLYGFYEKHQVVISEFVRRIKKACDLENISDNFPRFVVEFSTLINPNTTGKWIIEESEWGKLLAAIENEGFILTICNIFAALAIIAADEERQEQSVH